MRNIDDGGFVNYFQCYIIIANHNLYHYTLVKTLRALLQ